MYKLKIVSSTIRPERKGPLVANWITEIAKRNGNFDVELLDLGEINLPMMNALEYLFQKWGYKAAGIVSYGGVSAGTRATNSLKGELSTFKMVPITEAAELM